MDWDWEGAVDYTGIAESYEPQGELAREQQQSQAAYPPDFNIPYAVPSTEAVYPSPQHLQTSASTPASQNPLSPPQASFPPPPRPDIQTSMKRKAESEPDSATSSVAAPFVGESQPPSKVSRSGPVSRSSISAGPTNPADARPSATRTRTQDGIMTPTDGSVDDTGEDTQARKATNSASGHGKERTASLSKGRKIASSSGPGPVADVLPAGKVFPIQIGSELFRLSGASISSDAPSYFSRFFGEQLGGGPSKAGELKTLYIDRDPGVFSDIALHLQGYYVRPRNSEHFVKLFADAQFYSLPRLTQQLFKSEIFVEIGGHGFRIPRDLFSSPGDSPNFFSLGFAQFFSTPTDVFPGLDKSRLLRPPSIMPPAINNRSGETFAELMRLLQGYPLHIRNEDHRAELLRDVRYFHLKGLEQRIIACEITYNLLREISEVTMRLEDIRQSGISITPDSTLGSSESNPTPSSSSVASVGSNIGPGYVSYARPYVDEQSHLLILEIGSPESTRLHFSAGSSPATLSVRATFANQTLARVSSLFQVIANKMGLPATQPLGLMLMESGGGVAAQPISPANSGVSSDRVKVCIDTTSFVEVDGQQLTVDSKSPSFSQSWSTPRLLRPKRKRRNDGNSNDEEDLEDAVDFKDEDELVWVARRAHWRLRVVPAEEPGRMEIIMCAVRLEAFTNERARNRTRSFLA